MNEELFIKELADRGITLSAKQIEQFQKYFELLVEWNEKINLTAITEKKEVYLKHFFDSISPAFYMDFSKESSICDIGAGAGFPSIPLKICFPNLKVTIVDSLQKRITFLNLLANELDLKGVSFYHDRAETFAKKADMREGFDIVTARAVARLSVLSELCLPLVKVGGVFIALKGSAAEDEIQKGLYATKTLGGELTVSHKFTLPIENSERAILIIDKKRNTPKKFPRKPGTPNKEPLEV